MGWSSVPAHCITLLLKLHTHTHTHTHHHHHHHPFPSRPFLLHTPGPTLTHLLFGFTQAADFGRRNYKSKRKVIIGFDNLASPSVSLPVSTCLVQDPPWRDLLVQHMALSVVAKLWALTQSDYSSRCTFDEQSHRVKYSSTVLCVGAKHCHGSGSGCMRIGSITLARTVCIVQARGATTQPWD